MLSMTSKGASLIRSLVLVIFVRFVQMREAKERLTPVPWLF
jgi:hypothetical protein